MYVNLLEIKINEKSSLKTKWLYKQTTLGWSKSTLSTRWHCTTTLYVQEWLADWQNWRNEMTSLILRCKLFNLCVNRIQSFRLRQRRLYYGSTAASILCVQYDNIARRIEVKIKQKRFLWECFLEQERNHSLPKLKGSRWPSFTRTYKLTEFFENQYT